MIQSLGEKTIGGTVPMLTAASAQISAAGNLMLPDVQARASAALTIQPPALATDIITNLTALMGAVQALLASGVSVMPPSINASLGLELNATLGAIQGALDFALQLDALTGGAGVHSWLYEGADTQLGAALNGEIGSGLPGGPNCTAIVLATTIPGTAALLKTVFGL